MKRTMWVAAASAVALTGCAWFQSMEEKVGLTAAPDATITAACGKQPEAATDPVNFKLSEHPKEFTVHWKVVTPDFSFEKSGPVSDPTPKNGPEGQIYKCVAGGTEMTCQNKSTAAGSWKYTIPALKHKDGCIAPAYDPIISNQ